MESAADLIRQLDSPDYFLQQQAAWSLVKLADRALEPLMEALTLSQRPRTRYKAAWTLGKIGDSRAVEPLARALLNDPDPAVREWAAAALESLGHISAVPYLVQAVRYDRETEVRLRASAALRELKAVEELMELLSCEEPQVRRMAVTALARLKHEMAIDKIALMLQDPDTEVRRRAAWFMGQVRIVDASILRHGLEDPSPVVREEAVRALSCIKGERACELALSCLKDDDPRVRMAAVTSLGEIGHSLAVDALKDVLFGADHEEIRAWAAWSLGEIGDERAVEPLIRACRSCPDAVVEKAKNSLREVFNLET